MRPKLYQLQPGEPVWHRMYRPMIAAYVFALAAGVFSGRENQHKHYALQGSGAPSVTIVPFTGLPHIRNDDYVVTLNTPQFSRFTGSVFYIWGHDENFFEWSPANILFATFPR